jgi:mRNA interferase RelE/StbE
MRLFYTERFRRSYADAPSAVQAQCDKQLAYLAENLRHPSLQAKKYEEARNLWQARVNRSWRLYFVIEGDAFYLVDIMPHPK